MNSTRTMIDKKKSGGADPVVQLICATIVAIGAKALLDAVLFRMIKDRVKEAD